VEVNVKTRGLREEVEELAEATDLGVFSSQDQKGIICILDHRTWKVVNKRVQQAVATRLHGDEAGEEVGDGQVQVW
jgi:hypothetical protein